MTRAALSDHHKQYGWNLGRKYYKTEPNDGMKFPQSIELVDRFGVGHGI